MLDLNFIKQNPEKVKIGIKNKGFNPDVVDEVLKVNNQRVEILSQVEKIRQEKNQLNRDDIEKGRSLKEKLQQLEPKLKELEEKLETLLFNIPNIPADDVPVGKDQSENKVVRKWGDIPKFSFTPKDHLEIGEGLDIIDVERAAKVSGSRFYYLKNEGALLEMALFRFALDKLMEKGFKVVVPPVMISLDAMKRMGYFAGGEREDMYILDKDNLVLVGTSEQSIGPMHQDEIFAESDLPRRYVGVSTCFRREAGSYGKDMRGIIRAHQFNKVEMFVYTKPEESDKEHEFLLSLEEELMQNLGLPYQVVKIATGDLGITASRKFDIETWFPSQERYRETHSTSNTTDYQARGLNIKYKQQDQRQKFVHMLNGTAFSARPEIAILENFQQEDGSVVIPEVLRKYTGFEVIKGKK